MTSTPASRPGLCLVKRHLGTGPYTLYGGFAVLRTVFSYFNIYRTHPPGYFAKWSFSTNLGRISEKNDLFYEHDSFKSSIETMSRCEGLVYHSLVWD